MIIDKITMDEINSVQYEIFKAFHSVCTKLNLNYYLVHGSLLGAVRYKGFFPFDDDIDVVMPRKDYDLFIKKGKDYIGGQYFIQSYLSEGDWPIVFAKIRDNNTAFIQPILKNFDVNQGIYIDIFPLDNYPTRVWQIKSLNVKKLLLGLRVNRRFHPENSVSLKQKILHSLLYILYPSWKRARNMYCELYNNVPYTGRAIVRGGKSVEVNIPTDLFGKGIKIPFEGIISFAPDNYNDYLKLIYGDFMNYEPMGKDMVSDSEVNISADIVDVHKSYKEYLKKS